MCVCDKDDLECRKKLGVDCSDSVEQALIFMFCVFSFILILVFTFLRRGL